MIRTAAIIAVLAALGGCASFDQMQASVATSGAKAADEALQSAEWTLCNGISVGAWRRAYAGEPERAAAWADLCRQPAGVPK